MEAMLAKKFSEKVDPTGWLMSEKLDGVRAIFRDGQLWSRNNKPFFAPKWFLKKLPDLVLDGELYLGRGLFQKTISCVRKKKPINSEWRNIQYRVFDAPLLSGTFESRLNCCEIALVDNRVASVVKHRVCKSREHMEKYSKRLLKKGAEGIMLRQSGSAYEQKRSSALLKYKPVWSDEAMVVEHEPGKGKHEGRLGALHCLWKGKIPFRVGSGFDDAQREDPPAIGAMITFEYQGTTDAGVPRFPIYVTERDYE